MNARSTLAVAGGFVAIVSCGGTIHQGSTDAGATTINGTVEGHSLTATDAIFSASDPNLPGTVVVIGSFGDMCGKVGGYFSPPMTGLELQLAQNGAAVTSPGTWSIVGNVGAVTSGAGALFAYTDASCQVAAVAGFGGSVTVTDVSASSLAGTFDLLFASDHLTGSFTATSCPALSSGAMYTCQ